MRLHEWVWICFLLLLMFGSVAGVATLIGAVAFGLVTGDHNGQESYSYAPSYHYQPSPETRPYNWWEVRTPMPEPPTGPSYSGGASLKDEFGGLACDPPSELDCDQCCANGPDSWYGDPDCATTCAEKCGSYCGWEGEPGPCLQLLMTTLQKAMQDYPGDDETQGLLLAAACLHRCWGVPLETLQAQNRNSIVQDGEPCIAQALSEG